MTVYVLQHVVTVKLRMMNLVFVRAPLHLQLMAAAAGSTPGGAWEQQPLWRLQSAPVTLHLTSADSVRSSTGCVYMYAALQDKSLHKYKLVVPTAMPAAPAKVRLNPPMEH